MSALLGPMILLYWNCHRLGNVWTIHEVGDLIWAQDSTIVLFVKTWLIEAQLVGVLRKLKLKNNHCVWSENHGGGLMLLWREDVNVTVVGSSLNHIDALKNDGQDNSWRCSGFYGAPETQTS